MDDLAGRVARLEREARLWRLAAVGLLATGLAALPLASRAQKAVPAGTTVRAPFRVVDEQGRTLVRVDTDRDRNARLQLLDVRGTCLADLTESPLGGGLVQARTGTGRSVARLEGGSAGASVMLQDAQGVPGVEIGASQGDGGFLKLREGSGEVVFSKP